MAIKRLDWNTKVKVKLTEPGIQEYYRQENVRTLRLDEDGCAIFSLEDFMSVFGGNYYLLNLIQIVEGRCFYVDENDLK